MYVIGFPCSFGELMKKTTYNQWRSKQLVAYIHAVDINIITFFMSLRLLRAAEF